MIQNSYTTATIKLHFKPII